MSPSSAASASSSVGHEAAVAGQGHRLRQVLPHAPVVAFGLGEGEVHPVHEALVARHLVLAGQVEQQRAQVEGRLPATRLAARAHVLQVVQRVGRLR